MYRQGLGDCFLLTFYPGGDEKHVLIDCGTLGSKYTEVKLPDVIAEIDKTTNGHLHLVVATHQHQDHLSGFSRLSTVFSAANKAVDNVWLAWTEDPKDPDAKKLTKARNDMGDRGEGGDASLEAAKPRQRIRESDGLAPRILRRKFRDACRIGRSRWRHFRRRGARRHGNCSRTCRRSLSIFLLEIR